VEGFIVSGTNLLARLNEWGSVRLRDGQIEAEGPAPPTEDLRAAVEEHRDVLKTAILLSDPPAWLRKLFDLYWSGHETPVRLTSPATGQAETYLVHVSLKNIAAAVAAEIGTDPLRWEELRGEVEEALGSWEVP
jgi:hypothetical protein